MSRWNLEESVSLDQAAALPFRWRGARLEFCVITTSAGRWAFPKGYIDPGETPEQTALKEAFEEAGLHGRIVGEPIGCYLTPKNRQSKTVVVFLMEVAQCDDDWRESGLRERRWVSRKKARRLVARKSLQKLLDVAIEALEEREITPVG
jgi:8-oxo-dGTP pyrophosphatase MutT (NUDIX family)